MVYTSVLALFCVALVAATPEHLSPESSLHQPDTSDHKLDRRQSSDTCTFTEINRKEDALRCQADYLEAWREEIDESKCRNQGYGSSSRLCDFPHYINQSYMRPCYSDCAYRQFYYMECSNLGSQFDLLESECAIESPRYTECFHDKGDFCALKGNQTNQVLIECYASNTPQNSDSFDNFDFQCTGRCIAAVNAYVENTGCCISTLWNNTNHDSGLTIGQIFNKCGVSIPSPCTSYSPPAEMAEEYLACAREGALGVASPTSLLVIISASVGLLLAPFA